MTTERGWTRPGLGDSTCSIALNGVDHERVERGKSVEGVRNGEPIARHRTDQTAEESEFTLEERALAAIEFECVSDEHDHRVGQRHASKCRTVGRT